jgi:hypothetical protein
MRTLCFLIGCMLLPIALDPPPAHADDDSEPAKVEDLIRRGIELRRSGHDNRAFPLMKEAYERAPSPRTAAQLGLVEMALGYKLEAERHLTEAVGSRRDFWVNKNREILESSLESVRSAIGEVVVKGPVGADVAISGKNVGRLPLAAPIRLGEGPATIVASAHGFHPERQTVTVIGGKQIEVMFDLQRDVTLPANVASPEPAQTAPTDSASSGTAETVRKDDDTNRFHRFARPAAWSAAAGAAVLVGFGVFETFVAVSANHDFEQHIGPLGDNPQKMGLNCGADDPSHGGAGCNSLYQDLQRARTLAVVGYGAGGLLAVGSVLLFWTSSLGTRDGGASGGVTCAPSWPTGGVACRFTF